jgi:D-alanyl-lipoteichoic acid acyltransferase DltB (MBOAT superfamily)
MAYIPWLILILFVLIIVDYSLGLRIAKAEGNKRRLFLIISIVANVGALFFFKYFNFFNDSIASLSHLIHWNYSPYILSIALPLGLSFHVFQSLSYVIEVYRGKQEPERNLGIYALYVMFFPQLVAGPIERSQHMLHQFHESHQFNAENVRKGLSLVLWGFFKKLVIADNIAFLVDKIYLNVPEANGVSVIIAVLLFSYQLYCDFSGYSDIAVGSALVFGYDLTINFDRPYASKSIAEFWRRWHISLSNWLRDYLYYPLVFSGRKSKTKIYLSLFVTFALIGLWHGANWTYVVFGAVHGFYMVFSLLTVSTRKRIADIIGISRKQKLFTIWQTAATFILVSISFVFFRAVSLSQAFIVFKKIICAGRDIVPFIYDWRHIFTADVLGVGIKGFMLILVSLCILEIVQSVQRRKATLFVFEDKGRTFRWLWYYGLIGATLFFGYLGSSAFIYFKF